MDDAADFKELEKLRTLCAADAPQPEIGAQTDAVRLELEHRRYKWTYVAKHAAIGMSIEFKNEPSQRVPSFFSLPRYYLAGLFVAAGAVTYFALSPIGGVAIGVLGFAVVVASQFYANSVRANLLSSNTCLKCGYDLKPLPPAIDTAAIDGLSVGPLQCPECGRKWPTIPMPDGSA